MASLSVGAITRNVTVRSINDTTSSGLGSGFNVGNTAPVTGRALSTPGVPLTVQISAENDRGDGNTCTFVVADPSGSGLFLGEASLTWPEGDTSVGWVEFSNFPIQADGVTPVGDCDYAISLNHDTDVSSGTQVGVRVFTL
ncbi:hypothetical protein [Nonomuraea sp. NPDC046570]|uniref:hypothetical protein n=1 Tax=Nonomuraea sp. NPDC046570 TaxID=3155255 RepID=UPI003400EFEB